MTLGQQIKQRDNDIKSAEKNRLSNEIEYSTQMNHSSTKNGQVVRIAWNIQQDNIVIIQTPNGWR